MARGALFTDAERVAIATINAFNRVNAATRQINGDWFEQYISTEPAVNAA